MKRINFDRAAAREMALTRHPAGPMVILLAAVLLVIALFASAVSAGELAICDKVKQGSSGQSYAWKKDC